MHGKKNGKVQLDVIATQGIHGRRWKISIINEPGPKHAQNIEIQAQMGKNYLFSLMHGGMVALNHQIGCDTSTFQGLVPVSFI